LIKDPIVDDWLLYVLEPDAVPPPEVASSFARMILLFAGNHTIPRDISTMRYQTFYASARLVELGVDPRVFDACPITHNL